MTFSDIRELCFPNQTPAEAFDFRNTVTEININRERTLAILMIGISIILIAVDCLAVDGAEAVNLASAAILSRFGLILFLVAFLVATRRPPTEISFHHRAWDAAFVGVSLSWVSLFSGALLAVRPGIEPYLIAVFTVAAFLQQGASRSTLTFGLGLFLFSLSAVESHTNHRFLVSALVNGSIATLLAYIISRVVYAMQLRGFLNDAHISAQKKALIESNERLQRLSFIDPLTNLANRRFLDMSITREWKMHARSGFTMSVLMIDIDWFKSFNDSYGHLSGDNCLRRVAAALEETVRRPTDLVTRYGGEEFLVLLPMTNREGALCIATRMMNAVSELDVSHRGSPLGTVTVSIGISSCLPDHVRCFDDLLHSADTALYKAKSSGKNRIAWCCPILLLNKERETGNTFLGSISITREINREPEFDLSPEVSP